MKRSTTKPRQPCRRGVIAVLATLLMVVLFAMVAFAVDLGYITLVRTQLQAAADSAALAAAGASGQTTSGMTAVAQAFANYHQVAGRSVQLNAADVQLGSWDASALTFTPGATVGTAVKVTVRTATNSGGQTGLFFGKLFGLSAVSQQASAVACVNPRDIAFVVDLSGSMNDDTSPNSSTSSSSLMQNVYNDFGLGTYPGTSTSASSTTLNSTTKSQIQSYMPNATPTPNTSSSASKSYWGSYLSYLNSNGLKLGYQSYLQFMMYYGRDVKPDGSNYTPLSLNSNLCSCPLHSESVGGTVFSFPPREMPTHASRLALISAIQLVQSRNQTISDPNQQDWVSIITFDTTARIQQVLTSNYNSVMTACTQLQACSDTAACTDTEAGLSLAQSHIKPASQGGAGREHTNKIVVLLTDGQPNLQQSSNSTITTYMNANPSTWTNPSTGQVTNNWSVTGGYTYQQQAALMQTSEMQQSGWYVYAVGLGLNCSSDFMNRVARMGATANSTTGLAPPSAGDSTTAQANLTTIFNSIITNPKLRLVQ